MGKRFPMFMLIFLFLYCFIFVSGYASIGIIPHNVYMEGVDIGGISREVALEKVQEHFRRIKFSYLNYYCSMTPEELGIIIDYENSFRELENRRIWQRVAMNFQESHFSLWKEYHRDKMVDALEIIGEGINKPAQDATLAIVEGKVVTKPGVRGTKIEKEILIKKITEGNLKNHYTIPIVVDEPVITEEELENLKPTTLLAQYTTKFVKNKNRTENIRLACEALKNTLLAPGEVFSFNEVVGPREEDRGYLSAIIIQGGEFTPGLGGGICQVSSTLYNSVLLSGLEIVERHSHSLPIDYVPPGQDATVVYGLKDFKFKNNSPGYLLLDYKIEGQYLTISIFGVKKN